MKLTPIKHQDSRRVLTEWISDTPMKRSKVIEVKEKSILGNHYHLNSDSVFYIVKGKTTYWLKKPDKEGVMERDWLFEGESLFVPRGVVHTFEVYPDTIMLEACSEPYNGDDEIKHEIPTTY